MRACYICGTAVPDEKSCCPACGSLLGEPEDAAGVDQPAALPMPPYVEPAAPSRTITPSSAPPGITRPGAAVPPPSPSPMYHYAGQARPRGLVQTENMAILSLIFGIGGWVICPVVFGVMAIVFGCLARKRIRYNEAEIAGGGFATAGITLGYLQLLFTLAVGVFLLAVAIFLNS